MIVGVGNDIIAVERIRKILGKHYGQRFIEKVFTLGEQKYCYDHKEAAPHFAGRWALKEAFYKALPLELQPFSSWHSIELTDGSHNVKPSLRVTSESLKEKMTEAGITSIHHSISHEKEYAIAMVVLS